MKKYEYIDARNVIKWEFPNEEIFELVSTSLKTIGKTFYDMQVEEEPTYDKEKEQLAFWYELDNDIILKHWEVIKQSIEI